MEIVINNHRFAYDLGCRMLKLKYDKCPFPELNEFWDGIKPMTFKEIAKLKNLEERRVGIMCLGIERLVKEVNPILIDTQTIKKTTNFIDRNGSLVNKNFNDTYSLYKISGDYFNDGLTDSWRKMEDAFFVRCKDTSTDREYLIWIEPKSVVQTNDKKENNYYSSTSEIERKLNAVQAIAWTIQTTVEKGNISEILRQGDCILIKPKNPKAKMLETPRHLTEIEYRNFLIAES